MEWESFQHLIPGLAMLLALTVIFWLVVIRPTKQRQAEHLNVIESLTPGDRIVTVGGIHGTVRQVHENTFDLEVAKGTIVTFERRAARRIES